MKYLGWAGTILRVDLASEKIRKQELPEHLALNFIGGRGFNSKILYDEVDSRVDPFGPHNKLIFGTGPCAGTIVPCSGRWTVTTKSPTTNAFGDANSGGEWAAYLKWAGYDCIVFDSIAKKPVYLWIEDEQVELRNAADIWGLDVWDTIDAIKEEDSDVSVACIGPAGENQSNAACIMNDYTRSAGKCGTGAVMGSKNLKAIAVKGSKGIKVSEPDGLIKFIKETVDKLRTEDSWYYENLSKYGTPIYLMTLNELGALPTFNWREGWFEHALELSAETLSKKYVKKKMACNACIFHCSSYCVVEDGPYAGTIAEGVEYEATGGFGSKLGNSDLASTIAAKNLCDRLGLDLINCSDTIGWAMECNQNGLLSEEYMDGLDLSWGNHEAIMEALRKIAFKEGKLGSLLALGSRKAAERIGNEAISFSITVKGQQMGLLDPRAFWSRGLGFATSTRGGDHLRDQATAEFMFTPEESEKYVGSPMVSDRFGWQGKGHLIAWSQNIRAVNDSMETCKFLQRGSPWMWVEFPAKALRLVTGLDWTYETVQKCGERIYNVEKAFNVRAGLTRKDDYLPERFYQEALTKGPFKGIRLPKEKFDLMLNEYYIVRGWDVETGFPTREKLEELGLKYIADELGSLCKLASKPKKKK